MYGKIPEPLFCRRKQCKLKEWYLCNKKFKQLIYIRVETNTLTNFKLNATRLVYTIRHAKPKF